MVTLTFIFVVVLTLSLPLMSTPYALGSAFMVMLIFLSAYMMMTGPLWYPVVMFLIYVGALMVLFLYMTCLSPNMRIESPRLALIIGTFTIMALLLASIVFSITHFTMIHSEVDHSCLSTSLTKSQAPTDLMSRSSGDILVFSGLSLFFSLLSVVKICKHQKGPLRAFKREPVSRLQSSKNK